MTDESAFPPPATRRDSVAAGGVLSTRAIWTTAALLLVIGVAVAVGLVWAYGAGGEQERNQLEAIKTAGAIVIGTGGAAALLLAARRQRTAEQDLVEKRRDLALRELAHRLSEKVAADTNAHQLRVAEDARLDAAERRVTDLYTKAVDQLGSDKAPVRLGGIYALERLAQNNRELRQTVMDVLCAYLRMSPTRPPPSDRPDEAQVDADPGQEREVRLTAQRVIATHLRPGPDPGDPVDSFWADIDVDLTGAALTDLGLADCVLRNARFDGAELSGVARFSRAEFSGMATFDGAVFAGEGRFIETRFVGDVRFPTVAFRGAAGFHGAEFHGDADFSGTEFGGEVRFSRARFGGRVRFPQARFDGAAWFTGVAFGMDARFHGTVFRGDVRFDRAEFAGDVDFEDAEFGAVARFDEAELPETGFHGAGTASPWTDFSGARFEREVPWQVARFVRSATESS